MSVDSRRRKRTAVADPEAREFLRKADPVLARVIDAHPDFRPRAWIDELPGLDAFGTLIFQVAGQQLSVRATRSILARLEQSFGGHLPSPDHLPTEQEMLEVAEGWRPYRSLAVSYLFASEFDERSRPLVRRSF